MKNKKRKIIIWLMTWAVLFLVVAYSPIGRPDLYVGNSYYISNQGVNFKEGIANAPKGTAYATENDESEVPDYASTSNYTTDNAGNAAEYSPQNAGSGAAANYSKTTGSNQGSAQGGSIILSGNSSKGSAQGTATAQSSDVSSLSSDLTLTSSANRQTAPRSPNDRYDPGVGKKKPHDTIPVGDGVWLLLVMVGTYSFWKKHQATKANSTTHR